MESSTAFKQGFDSYFSEISFQKRVFYMILLVYVTAVSLICVVEPLLTPESCVEAVHSGLEFGNSLFKYNPCRYTRKYYLLLLTPDECSYSRRLVIAVILGGLIGWERVRAKEIHCRIFAVVLILSLFFATTNSSSCLFPQRQADRPGKLTCVSPLFST